MANSRPDPDPDPGDESAVARGRRLTTGPPRWVKVFGIIALVLVVMVVVMLMAGGNHGPGRHFGSGARGQSTSSSVTESGDDAGHRPPAGGHTP